VDNECQIDEANNEAKANSYQENASLTLKGFNMTFQVLKVFVTVLDVVAVSNEMF